MRFLVLVLALLWTSCGKDGVAPPVKNNGSNNGITNNATNNQNNGTNNANNQNNPNNTNNNNLVCTPLDPALEGPCDALCQTGCGAGEHCITVQASGNDPVTTECEQQMGAGQGAPCNATTDCGEGFSCRNFRGDQACRAYCRPDGPNPPQCPFDHACIPISDPRIGICIFVENLCDPTPTDTCATPGEECYDFPSGRRCEMAGDILVGEACASSADCAEGLRCVGDGVENLCRELCDPANPMCSNDLNCAEIRNQNGVALSWGACF